MNISNFLIFVLLFVSLVHSFNPEEDICFPDEFEYGTSYSYEGSGLYLSGIHRSVPKNMAVFDITAPSNWTRIIGRGWLVPRTQKLYYSDYSTGECAGHDYKMDNIGKLCVKNVKLLGPSRVGTQLVVILKGTIDNISIIYTAGPGIHGIVSTIYGSGNKSVEKTVYNYSGRITHPLIFNIPRKCFGNGNNQIPNHFINLVKDFKPFV